MPELLCLGEAMIEFNQTEPGGMYMQGFGGDTSNTAIAAARLGVATAYMTRVGADAFGDLLVELWEREGLSCAHVTRGAGEPTGAYFVTHGPDGHRFSYRRAGSSASLMTPADLGDNFPHGAKALHVSAISQAISSSACDTVFEAIERMHVADGLVSYDTNLRLLLWPLARARAIVKETISMSDIVLPGLDDAMLLTGLEQPDAIADYFLRLGAKVVALTMGEKGVLVATENDRKTIDAFQVKAVDATGAGDAFDGAFLSRYLRQADPFAAARYANAAAALSVQGYSAVAPLPRQAEVEAFLKGHGCAL